MKMIKTRRAAIEDLPSLVEINKSDVEEWHHFSRGGRGAAASYDELTGWERVMHGGPWEDLHALRRHRPYMERVGIICLVAELDGRVVGHLDVIPTRELRLGEYLFLDVFMVHRSYRRRGVGTALLRAAEALAAEESLPRLVVMTDYEEAGSLTYRSYGFEPFHEMCTLEAEIGSPAVPTGVMITDPPWSRPWTATAWFAAGGTTHRRTGWEASSKMSTSLCWTGTRSSSAWLQDRVSHITS